jgi:hypothetical protein
VQLLTRLRDLRAIGLSISAAAIDFSKATRWDADASRRRFSPASDIDVERSRRDFVMAERLFEFEANGAYDLIIAYTGSSHVELTARPKSFFSPDTGKVTRHMVTSVGALLPGGSMLSLKFVHRGGSAYAHRGPGGQGFAAIPGDPGIDGGRAIVLHAAHSPDFPFHGHVSVGAISASPPVLGAR